MNQIRALETFAKVVELGSFVRAAEALDLSSAGVTRDIAQLEAHLGTRLLQRHARRLVLTETGASYYERCKQVLADLHEADAMASASTLEAAGVLRLNAPVAFGTLHLAPLLPQFRALYPKVELDITLNDRFVDLIEENVDMALRIARLPSSTLVARPISHTCLVACAAPTYLQQRGIPTHPHDLSQHDGLGYSYASSKDEWEFRSPQGEIVRLPVRCTFHANHGSLLHAACLAGAGIALLPSFIVGADLLSGQLVPVLMSWQTEPLGIYVVYPTRKHLSAKVHVMRDFLTHAFPDPPPWEKWQTG